MKHSSSFLGSFYQRMRYVCVGVRRFSRCLGFGIQSPTDYSFVRDVINEHRPYYAYEWLGRDDSWEYRRLGLLYFRIANWHQPSTLFDGVGAIDYLQEGCRHSRIASAHEKVDLAVASLASDVSVVLDRCNDHAVLIVEDIQDYAPQWKELIGNGKVTVSFDLYYCGIVFFDKKRVKQHYLINF